MADGLTDAIEGLDPSSIGCSAGMLVDACAALNRLEAVVTEAVGVFDAQGLWGLDQAVSMTAWLRGMAAVSGRSAAAMVHLARKLRQLPVTAAAVRDGSLSCDQAGGIAAHVDADLLPQFREHEAALVPILSGLSVADVYKAMTEWEARARLRRPDRAPADERRALHLSPLLDDAWKLDATLTVEGGELVKKALDAAGSLDGDGEPVRTASQKRVDALVDVCRWFLDHRGIAPSGKRQRPHIDAAVAADDLADDGPGRTSSGLVLDPTTLQRLACDAAISRLLVKGRSHILDYGRSVRIVPAGLFLALVLRDRHCRWPGCDRTADWCEAHHLVHWLRHGPTELDNLALLCSRHHHMLHLPDWHAKIDPYDATLTITTPDGRRLTSRPPPILMTTSLFDTG